tara:strand:+ start:593 stop:1306 length:714 start_codon:yes stop_codon:yes gene_type:complete
MNILIQENSLNKFTNNLALLKNEHNIHSLDINNRLYGIHDKLNINFAVFTMSMMSKEIMQYIIEFSNHIKIVIYHDKLNLDFIKAYSKHCVHLVEEENIDKCSTIPNLLNEQIFIPNVPKNNKHKIITFLNEQKRIPESLLPFLHPAPEQGIKIKIFNSPFVQHVQNLGMLREKQKNTILNNSEYFIACDNKYIIEALYLGCKVLTLDELKTLKPKQYTKIPEYTTYNNYLKVLLNA